jgi:hypothetical protein
LILASCAVAKLGQMPPSMMASSVVATALRRRDPGSNNAKAPRHPPSRGFGVAGSEAATTFVKWLRFRDCIFILIFRNPWMILEKVNC